MNKYLILTNSLLLLLTSCDYVDGLYRDGEFIETEISIQPFEKIRIETPVNLILEQTIGYNARISGLDFKVNSLEIKLVNDELVISSKGISHARKNQMPTVILPVSILSEIHVNAPSELSSSGELEIQGLLLIISGRGTYSNSNLKVKGLKFSIAAYGENQGTHKVQGAVAGLYLTMEGLANAETLQLNAQNVIINQRSLKSSYIFAANSLQVNMYSSGNVYYNGNPELNYNTFDPGWDVVYGMTIKQPE